MAESKKIELPMSIIENNGGGIFKITTELTDLEYYCKKPAIKETMQLYEGDDLLVEVKIVSSLDKSTEVVGIIPKRVINQRYGGHGSEWGIHIYFHKDYDKYKVEWAFGMWGTGADINAEMFAKARNRAIHMCKTHDRSSQTYRDEQGFYHLSTRQIITPIIDLLRECEDEDIKENVGSWDDRVGCLEPQKTKIMKCEHCRK